MFVTSSFFTTVASISPYAGGRLQRHRAGVFNHSHLLFLLFSSLTREAPPLEVTVRGIDEAAERMTELAKRIGHAENGTTFVSGMKTPEMTQLFDENGNLMRSFIDDQLQYCASASYVKKHAEMIQVALHGWCED